MACCKTNSIAISFIVPTSKIKKNTHTHRDGNGHLLPYVTPLPPGGGGGERGVLFTPKIKGGPQGAGLYYFSSIAAGVVGPHRIMFE